jgi:anti-anti-sigma regulatory factor
LRIIIQETPDEIEMRLEGRVAGPWAEELGRVWVETAPQLAARKLSIDLHNVTYADASGKQVLRAIYAQTNAQLIASTPWTQFLAAEVAANDAENVNKEKNNA